MSTIATVYGQALYDLAKEEGVEAAIMQQLTVLEACFRDEPDFIRLLCAANLSKAERCDILERSFRDRVHPHVLSFMKLLTEKGYMRHFSGCCKVCKAHYNADHGILEVQAVTATPLTEQQKQRLQEKLTTLTGKQVELLCSTDPAVLGGVRLDYDGRRVDDTVAHRMDSLRRLLKSTVL